MGLELWFLVNDSISAVSFCCKEQVTAYRLNCSCVLHPGLLEYFTGTASVKYAIFPPSMCGNLSTQGGMDSDCPLSLLGFSFALSLPLYQNSALFESVSSKTMGLQR